MKNLFNAHRFGLLFRKHTTENYRTYLMSAGVLTGIMALGMGFLAFNSNMPINASLQSVAFAFFMMGAGTIFTSTVFANLGEKNRAIATLMLPASTFEKYLVGWLFSFVLFLLVFTGSFYLVDYMVVTMDGEPGDSKEFLNIFTRENFLPSMLLIYGMLHGVALWGAITFEKLSFIKTAFIFFVFITLLMFLNNQALEGLFGRELMGTVPFAGVRFQNNQEYFSIELPRDLDQLFSIAFLLTVALLMWLAAFARLKEKQI